MKPVRAQCGCGLRHLPGRGGRWQRGAGADLAEGRKSATKHKGGREGEQARVEVAFNTKW